MIMKIIFIPSLLILIDQKLKKMKSLYLFNNNSALNIEIMTTIQDTPENVVTDVGTTVDFDEPVIIM